MALLVTTSISVEAWDEFTSSNSNASIFHTRRFISCFRNSPKYTPHTYFLAENNETVATIKFSAANSVRMTLAKYNGRAIASRAALIYITDGSLTGLPEARKRGMI